MSRILKFIFKKLKINIIQNVLSKRAFDLVSVHAQNLVDVLESLWYFYVYYSMIVIENICVAFIAHLQEQSKHFFAL